MHRGRDNVITAISVAIGFSTGLLLFGIQLTWSVVLGLIFLLTVTLVVGVIVDEREKRHALQDARSTR